jgi:hypothetical protein
MLLNAMSRQYILNGALDHAFGARKKALEIEYEKIAVAVYNALFSHDVQKCINALPKCFYREGGTVHLNVAGQRYQWSFTNKDQIPGAPVTASYKLPTDTWHELGTLTPAKHNALITRIHAYHEDRDTLKNERTKAEITLTQLLKGTKTLEQLKGVWPEGIKFYKNVKAAVPTPPGLPAVAMADLNKMLRIAA